MVVGIGGVGSWAVEALARSGVGKLTLVDLDHISESNINRQIHALDDTVGQAKVEAMAARIGHINPDCRVLGIDDFVEPDNWAAMLAGAVEAQGPLHAVIDACDEVRAKLAMAVWARSGKHRFISVGAAGGKRLAHKVEIDDIALATHDPLLATLLQSVAQAARCAARRQEDRRDLRLQPRGRGAARRIVRHRRGRWQPQLPR